MRMEVTIACSVLDADVSPMPTHSLMIPTTCENGTVYGPTAVAKIAKMMPMDVQKHQSRWQV